MPFTWLKPALLVFGVWLSSAPAEPPKGETQPHSASLAGQFVVASPDIGLCG